jgi:hypothetical protein
MPRFFFHVHNGIGLIEDEYGRELPDLARVRAEAIKGIRSIIADEVLKGRIDLRGHINIADELASAVMTVSFEEAFEVTRGSNRQSCRGGATT